MLTNSGGTGGLRRVWKTRTWEDNWNNVIRNVLFQSNDLKSKMLIPTSHNKNIAEFIKRYFVMDVASDTLVINEAVRISWFIEANPFIRGGKNVHQKILAMDIYVKDNRMYDVDSADGLKARDVEIAKLIRFLLTQYDSVEHISFTYEDEFRLLSKTPGYNRLRLVFSYFTTY